jgi:hypothetical protein
MCFLVRLKPAFDHRGSHRAMLVLLCGAFECIVHEVGKERRSDGVRGERSHVSTSVVCWYASSPFVGLDCEGQRPRRSG